MGFIGRNYERLRSAFTPVLSRKKRSRLVDAVAEHFGKLYFKKPVSIRNFTEQKSLESSNGRLDNRLNRLDYNRLFYESNDLNPLPAEGDASETPDRFSRLEEILTIINNDGKSFRADFVDNPKTNHISWLAEDITRIAKAKPDKMGYFSIEGYHNKEQIGRNRKHSLLKLDYMKKAIDLWVNSLEGPDFNYLTTDHLRTGFEKDPVSGNIKPGRAMIHINEQRKERFRNELYSLLIPRIAVKEAVFYMEDRLADLRACITGAGNTDGFTKPVAKQILGVMKNKDIAKAEELDKRIEKAKEGLQKLNNFGDLNSYFMGLYEKESSVGMKLNISVTGAAECLGINMRPATLFEWAEEYLKLEDAIRQTSRLYFERQERGKTVAKRVRQFIDTAIAPAENPREVDRAYSGQIPAEDESNKRYHDAVAQKHTYQARRDIRKQRKDKFREVANALRPMDKSQLKKSPFEKMDTVIGLYKDETEVTLRQDIGIYVCLAKALDYIDAAGTSGRYDSMRCMLQDAASAVMQRLARKTDAYPEIYRE